MKLTMKLFAALALVSLLAACADIMPSGGITTPDLPLYEQSSD